MIAALQRISLSVLLTAATLVAAAAPAHARTGHPETLTVDGHQVAVTETYFQSHGGLLGDFWILTFVPLYESNSLVIATGTERFVGCVDVDRDEGCESHEPSGELRFDYVQWATYEPSTGALIEGNCVHPITGGRDDFQGARGLVTMHDVLVDGAVRTTYQGTVVRNAVVEEPAAPEPPTARAFAAAAATAQPVHC